MTLWLIVLLLRATGAAIRATPTVPHLHQQVRNRWPFQPALTLPYSHPARTQSALSPKVNRISIQNPQPLT